MNGLLQYILSVIAAAILCSVVHDILPPKSVSGKLLKLVSGIFLTFVILSPVKTFRLPEFSDQFHSLIREADQLTTQGQNQSGDAARTIIKDRTEAYILDKAASLSANLSVEVGVSEDSIPVSVTLTGSASPYARSVLETFIETQLGIAKEDQTWNGKP